MKKFCCALFATLLFFSSIFADNDIVSNVTPYQEGRNIVIEYDLSNNTDITPYVSVNRGAYVQLKNVSGDVGNNVEAGHRRMLWDVLSQYEKFDFFDVRFKLEKSANLASDICGNTYLIVSISTQVWMAENLRCSKYDTQSEAYNAAWLTNNKIPTSNDAVYTPYYTDASEKRKWNNNSKTKYGVNLTDAQVAKLGYLYNWAAAVGVEDGWEQKTSFKGNRQGICPNGWHIPTKAEWSTLANYIDGNDGKPDAGKKLKTTSGWYDNGNGTDTYGFAALPAGNAYGSSVYGVGYNALFWTATPNESYSNDAYYRYLSYYDDYLDSGDYDKSYGQSVRCLRD